MTFFLNTVGAIAASAAFIIGRLAANFNLLKPNQRARHKMTKKWEM
jgi:hypothetical protein